MRKLLICCTIALQLATVLGAQTPAGSRSQPAATPSRNTQPASNTTRSSAAPAGTSTRSSAAPAANKQRAATATPSRTTQQPGASTRSTAKTELSPAGTRSNTPEPGTAGALSRTASPSKPPTAKTVPAQMPAAPATLQASEPMLKVQWMTLEEALEKSKTEKRKIFIDVYTDWCGWCKRMDESTFVDPEVSQYLNDNYYPVKFNAEQQQDIEFNNKTYHFKKNGARGYHELAAEWLNNRLSFPTVVFLDESFTLIQAIPTYLEAPKLETIINYFGTDSHKTTPWETYERKYNSTQQR
ncbi:MAG: DUF255 domain-containing protein [Saprospiraceae bacterium]|nr:DUF255 domain-containing protein [Saprospiraceae bacterium]